MQCRIFTYCIGRYDIFNVNHYCAGIGIARPVLNRIGKMSNSRIKAKLWRTIRRSQFLERDICRTGCKIGRWCKSSIFQFHKHEADTICLTVLIQYNSATRVDTTLCITGRYIKIFIGNCRKSYRSILCPCIELSRRYVEICS